MQELYEAFFMQYCRFISKDLLATFDKRLGRNTRVINTFYKIFFIINSNEYDNETKKKALNNLTIQIDSYLTDGDTSIYSEMYNTLKCANKTFVKQLGYLNRLQVSLNDFNEAVSDFNQVHKDELFKQGLIEFNNALAHLFRGFAESETNFEMNIKKACTHLYRGSLDYYKTLIKNKESLTHQQKIELIVIRDLEISSIGLDIANKTKDNILISYKNFTKKLHKI